MEPLFVDADGNPARICVFCQATGSLSKEHILAKKWRKVLGNDVEGQFSEGWHAPRGDFGAQVPHVDNQPGQAAFSRTVNTVCRSCNNGWMNDLEKWAETALLPLALGQEIEVDAEQLAALQAWVAKTAIILETADPGAKAFTLPFTGVVMSNAKDETAPPSILVWAFPVEKTTKSTMRSMIGGGVYTDHQCTGHFYRTTLLQLGAIAFISLHAGDPLAFGMCLNAAPLEPLGDPTSVDPSTGAWVPDRTQALSVQAVFELTATLHARVMRTG